MAYRHVISYDLMEAVALSQYFTRPCQGKLLSTTIQSSILRSVVKPYQTSRAMFPSLSRPRVCGAIPNDECGTPADAVNDELNDATSWGFVNAPDALAGARARAP